MITIKCDKRNAQSERLELLTSGSAGIQVRFEFSPEWEGLNIMPCFCCGDPNDPTVLRTSGLSDGECCVPQEVLTTAGKAVWAGAYGYSDDGTVIIPTVWTLMGICRNGVDPYADPGAAPQLPGWSQLESLLGELSDLETEDKSSLVAAINEVYDHSGGSAVIDMCVSDGYIRYTTDGEAWQELIAVAELKGDTGFPGSPGADGADGRDGADGADGRDGADGADGADGYTPVRGVDYWTAADIATIDDHIGTAVSAAIGAAIGGAY